MDIGNEYAASHEDVGVNNSVWALEVLDDAFGAEGN
jgi:hypothetical protein